MKSDPADNFSALEKAMKQKDADEFEEAFTACFPIQNCDGFCELLAKALLEDWHFRHEDVALAIQELKCAGAVEALEQRASSNPSYLDWDEGQPLARARRG